jgi:hypothetical protein
MSDLYIAYDETFRTVTVYASDADELSNDDAREYAERHVDSALWTFVDCETVNYNGVAVRFQRL